jgi:pimeloyl-ACP methyl ester carboxylesterase
MSLTPTVGYAPVNGVEMYWECGGDGTPLIVVLGGFGVASMFGEVLDRLTDGRRVIAVELQGHGHTRDIDRPFSFEAFGDDIAALVEHLGLGEADLLGYSLGGGACLRCAIQHPEQVRRLALVSTPCRQDAWFPEVRAGMAQVNRGLFDQMRHSPMYRAYADVAPDPDAFPALMDKTGQVITRPYDWSAEVRCLTLPTLLLYGDADSIPPAHAAEFFALLGGGLRDAGWDGSGRTAMRLAILAGATHYDIFEDPRLAAAVADFLA